MTSQAYAYMPTSMNYASSGAAMYQQPNGAMLQGMAPYNPSYLITQSNQLFNQHQQNLNTYKQQASPGYIPEFSQNTITYNPYLAKAQAPVQTVQHSYDTGANQLHGYDTGTSQLHGYDTAASQLQQIQALQAAATQLQFESGVTNDAYNPYHEQQAQPQIATQNNDPYAQLIEGQDYNPYTEQNYAFSSSTQAPLSQKDLVSIFKYGTLSQSGETQEVQNYPQNYYEYHNQPQQQNHYQPSHSTQQPEVLQGQETLTPQSAYELHQQALSNQLANSEQQQQYQQQQYQEQQYQQQQHNQQQGGSLRIIVPDEVRSLNSF